MTMGKQAAIALETDRKKPIEPDRSSALPSADGPAVVLALIERISLDPCAGAEKLERIVAMFERLKAGEAELAFNAAKARILKKLSNVKIAKSRSVLHQSEKSKPRTGSVEAFKYAPLEEIDKHLRPLLTEEDMDLSYSNEPSEDGGVLIRGRLKQLPSGHYEDSFMQAPRDSTGGKSDVQAVGSTNSFLRRYVACNIFNIVVVGDDDDGIGGTVDPDQTKTIVNLIRKTRNGPKFLKYMKALSIEEAGSLESAVATIAARDYRKAISTLEEQLVKAEVSDAGLSS
jgi:ERF superfamily